MWFENKIEDTHITVVGLGYVGLPEAIAFYESGFKVTGLDIDKTVLEKISNRINPLLDEIDILIIPKKNERWMVTDNYEEVIPKSQIIIVAVPTPIDDNYSPDLNPLNNALNSIFREIEDCQKVTIIVESTVYPGATKEIVDEVANKNNKREHVDYMIAYCPERVNPGDSDHNVKKVARVIGCKDEVLGRKLAEMYSLITESGCKYVGSIEVAEASKMIENVQRDVDIALTNELAIVLSDFGLDIEEVFEAADSKWNFHRHTPGIGVGGHCIPVDPYYYFSLAEKLGHTASISYNARKTNENMPNYVFESIKRICKKENTKLEKILILGYAYKENLGDSRMTPIKPLSNKIIDAGIELVIWDPHVSSENNKLNNNILYDLNSLYSLNDVDMVILGTAHEVILNLDWELLKLISNNSLIYDGRRVLNNLNLEKIGWKYYGIGKPI